MSDFFQAMTLPFLSCLLLSGIHVYLGIHVIARKVIFVDLALAQMAALGGVIALYLGYQLDHDPWVIKGFSFTFAVFGAWVFALTRMRHERIPQEASIGIAYAAGMAGMILVSANLAHGMEEVNQLLSGNILWVTPAMLVEAASLYGVVALIHIVFRKRFLAMSFGEPESSASNVRLWDFFFYVTFALVVTSSVAIAGVLLVFAYLVVPACVAVLVATKLSHRLIIGWAVGAGVSFVGCVVSYYTDMPSGPAIVLCFVVCLVAAALTYRIAHVRPCP